MRADWILATLLGVVPLLCAECMAQRGSAPAPVVVSPVTRQRQTGSTTFVGTLRPTRKSTVGSAVEGRVVAVYVEEGDRIGADPAAGDGPFVGQPLVQLRTGTLDIEIKAAEVELELRKQSLDELEQSLPLDIALASATLDEAKAQLAYVQKKYERFQQLGSGVGVSADELDEAFSIYQARQQAAIAAQATLDKLQATKDVRIAIAKTRVAAQEEEINRLNDLRERYTIRAPFPGFVTRQMADVGDWLNGGATVMDVVQLDQVEMTIHVPQSYLAKLQQSLDSASQQQPLIAQVQIDSLPQLLEGKVDKLVPQADLRTRTFPVVIRLANPPTSDGFLLKSGMLGRASLAIGAEADVMLVPKDALVLGEQTNQVFAVRPGRDGAAAAVPVVVQIGAARGQWIEVQGGLADDDQVVVRGNERLFPMQPVNVIDTQPFPDTQPPPDGSDDGP